MSLPHSKLKEHSQILRKISHPWSKLIHKETKLHILEKDHKTPGNGIIRQWNVHVH